MKVFVGTRVQRGATKVTVDGKPLRKRFDLRNHSPTGFEWGYSGSGPAQLGLAICAEVVGDERALRVYQDFKANVLSTIDQDYWEMTDAQVLGSIERIERDTTKGR